MARLSREDLLEVATSPDFGLDEFDQEEVVGVVDMMLEAYTPLDILSWFAFPDIELDDESPITAIRDGRARQVRARARRLVLKVSVT